MNKSLFILAATCAFYIFMPVDGNAKNKKAPLAPPTTYTLDLLNGEITGVVDINNRGDILISRQMDSSGLPVPLLIRHNGKETGLLECPGISNHTTGTGINNSGEISGGCGEISLGFIANPANGSFLLLAFPGARSTLVTGLNDVGQAVGVYTNRITPTSCCIERSFVWNKATGQYTTIHNPLADTVGGKTVLIGINNKGQILGYYDTANNIPVERYPFLFDNGAFIPIAYPGADRTLAVALNNNTQILGWYSNSQCAQCGFLYDNGQYYALNVPIPDHVRRPNGAPAGVAFHFIFGMNDDAQFVGEYSQITEWRWSAELGQYVIASMADRKFVATPTKK